MLFEFVLRNNVLLIIGCGVACAAAGLFFRSGPSATKDRDNLVYADGFQGVTIATLLLVATMIYYIDDPRAVLVLREQASVISTFAILGVLQLGDRFRRSLRE